AEVVRTPVKMIKIKAAPTFAETLRKDLEGLLDSATSFDAAATRAHDGRRRKVVLLTLADRAGRSRAGVPVHLLDATGAVVDRAFTSRTGLVVLTFPAGSGGGQHDHEPDGPEAVEGRVRILDGTEEGTVLDVVVPVGSQFVDLTHVMEVLPGLPVATDGLWPPVGAGGDPLTRLPADFTPELCDAIAAKAGDEGDSLLGRLGKEEDFRSRRTPLVKRLTVVRNGTETVSPGSNEPKRYLVRLRQSWIFLGYTLGELAEVDALDPGQVLDETVGTVERVVDQVDRVVDTARRSASSSVLETLSQANRIDSVVRVAASSSAHAAAGGFALGIPGVFGIGGGGAVAGTSATTTTSTRVDTSLQVNHALTTAQSAVNEAVHSATSSLHTLARTVTSKVGQVSPLLSRVTNLLRWRVYENYAVCTHVEDVREMVSVRVFEVPAGTQPVDGVVTSAVFTAEEIVEYRRFFEPALLDPRFAASYPSLVQAVEQKLAGGRSISHVTVDVDYSALLATGRLTAELNGAWAQASLQPGGTRARLVVRFAQPVSAADLSGLVLRLTATPSYPSLGLLGMPSAVTEQAAVDVTSVRLWAGVEPGSPATHAQSLGSGLRARPGSGSEVAVPFTVTPPVVDTRAHPLFVHVNQNPSHYLGVLAQAALQHPSLREDSAKLRGVPKEVWRLPVVGFEGSRIIVAKDPVPGSEDVERLLHGDKGAATLVQLASPGAYGEALEGLLSLADAEGKLHPRLLPLPAPAVPPLAVVDLTGQRLVPDGVPVVPSPPAPVPVPPQP
ncbi:MAG TPA: hypothetical protein VNU66_02865, partial [Mycobacteriales bacterium]|nr:hypothetical protein [Mycobacteriales bacterium]